MITKKKNWKIVIYHEWYRLHNVICEKKNVEKFQSKLWEKCWKIIEKKYLEKVEIIEIPNEKGIKCAQEFVR